MILNCVDTEITFLHKRKLDRMEPTFVPSYYVFENKFSYLHFKSTYHDAMMKHNFRCESLIFNYLHFHTIETPL